MGAAGQRRPLAILAVIAAAGERGVARETIQTLFSPDSDADHARGALKQALYAFRRDVEEQEITLGTNEIRLNPAVISSDVGGFRSAIAGRQTEIAASLYAGPFLEGVYLKDLEEFGRWVDRERGLLAREYRSALENLAKASAVAGDHLAAAKWWGKLAAEDPYASRIAMAYMRGLATAGEREAGIRHGEIHTRLVRDELGAEPEPEVANMLAEMRATSKGRARGPASAPEKAGVRTPDASSDRPAAGESDRVAVMARGSWLSRPIIIVASAMVIVVVVAVAAFGASSIWRSRTGSAPSHAPTNRVVVVPFENRTGDKALDPLGPMTADWIIDGLSRAALIPVVDPATAAYAWRETRSQSNVAKDPLLAMAEATKAATIVAGSIYRRGDNLEFQGRISDAKTSRVLASIEPVNVPLTLSTKGIEIIRERILGALAREFDPRLSQFVAAGASPPSFAAYKEFVTGIDLLTSGDTYAVDLGHKVSGDAITHFRRAYALDTTFTAARLWMMFGYDKLGQWRELESVLDSLAPRRNQLTPIDRYAFDYFRARSVDNIPAAIRAAEAASDLAPLSVWSWNAASMLFPVNRPREALKYIGRIDPNRGWASRPAWEGYWYFAAQARHLAGDLPGAWKVVEHARPRFPQNVAIAAAYARALALRGETHKVAPIVREILQSDDIWRTFYAYSILADLQRHGLDRDAAAVFQQVTAWIQGKGESTTEFDRRDYGRILFETERWDSARRQFDRLIAAFPKSGFRMMSIGHVSVLAAMRGDSALAVESLNSISEKDQTWPGEKAYWRARLAAQLGHKDEAVALLQAAFDKGYPQVSLAHTTWYDFPPLQGYPPFEALVASDR